MTDSTAPHGRRLAAAPPSLARLAVSVLVAPLASTVFTLALNEYDHLIVTLWLEGATAQPLLIMLERLALEYAVIAPVLGLTVWLLRRAGRLDAAHGLAAGVFWSLWGLPAEWAGRFFLDGGDLSHINLGEVLRSGWITEAVALFFALLIWGTFWAVSRVPWRVRRGGSGLG